MAVRSAPDSLRAVRRRLLRGWAALGLVGVLGLAYLAVANPHDSSVLMPKCPTKFVTGLDCPGCGGLRMTHDLLHGDLVSAAHSNIFLLGMIPVTGVLGWRYARARWQGEPLIATGELGRKDLAAIKSVRAKRGQGDAA